MTQSVDDFLAHYGVKGMRWGVRKSRNEVDRLKPDTDRAKPTVTRQALEIFKSKFSKISMKEIGDNPMTDSQQKSLDQALQDADNPFDVNSEGGD